LIVTSCALSTDDIARISTACRATVRLRLAELRLLCLGTPRTFLLPQRGVKRKKKRGTSSHFSV
jgi:hypothetical protein